jgi:hypothetical protein
MKLQGFAERAGVVVTLGVIAIGVTSIGSPRVRADDDDQQVKIQIGFQIAPVKLNLAGKDPALVGLGSYLVNAIGDCNGCHTGGGPPNFNYAAGGNPYFGQKTKVDPTVYLSGGQDFGPVGPPPSPDIIARNLTPDKTGRPEGGHTYQEFVQIIRHGKDFDHLHLNCTGKLTTNCIPSATGVDGDLLQIMPWPTFNNMTDHDLLAIYTYLSAIPCIEGPTDPNNPLHNNCH